ncbi:MAG TPA: MFS transporter [Candidatus Binatia bacterium]|nr:MFS transporter [Candidatus Binatia bacterium]
MARFSELFRPPPALALDGDAVAMRARYRYWRIRQLYATFGGYAVFYFLRKNIPIALPALEGELGLDKARLGMMLTAHDFTYGIAKFGNGFLADRANARVFMPLGLALSAVMNLLFGMSAGITTLALVWTLNGWFQGMGFPPCARVLAHWFSPKERGLMWGIWNCSHQVGAATILVGAGLLVRHYGWRSAFVVPGLIALVAAIWLYNRLRDTPGSLGLPTVEVYRAEPAAPGDANMSPDAFRAFVRKMVFGNPLIWFAAAANFFVYAIRYGFVNWAPSYLYQRKGIHLDFAGGMVAGFELAGLVGGLLAGFITDRFFASRRGPICFLYMVLLACAIGVFWLRPPASIVANAALLCAVGFLVYGPQFLVGVMVADLATKQAAATAVGLTGLFGYTSGIVSGWGLGFVLDKFGWTGGFGLLVLCALAGAFLFALTWRASPTVSIEPSAGVHPPP